MTTPETTAARGAAFDPEAVDWSDPAAALAAAREIETLGQAAVAEELRRHRAAGRSLGYIDDRGELVLETPDGRRSAISRRGGD